jgi:hypothetical protein
VIWWEELPARSRVLGRSVVVALRELTIEEFAASMPEVLTPGLEASIALNMPPAPQARKEWDAWCSAMLARAIVEPAYLKAPARVMALGDVDRTHLVERLLERLGVGKPLPYTKGFIRMVGRLAHARACSPTELMQLPTSTFWRDYMILCGPESDHAA